MGTEMDDAIKLATLEEQVAHLVKTTDEIRDAIAGIKNIDVRMAEIVVRFESTRGEMTTMWKKLDRVQEWTETHDKASAEIRMAFNASIAEVKNEVEAVVNKGQGAWRVLSAMLGIMQVVLLATGAWLFNNINDANKMNAVHQYRLEQLEKAVKPSEQTKLGATPPVARG